MWSSIYIVLLTDPNLPQTRDEAPVIGSDPWNWTFSFRFIFMSTLEHVLCCQLVHRRDTSGKRTSREELRHVSWICRWDLSCPNIQSTPGGDARRNVANISRCRSMPGHIIESLMTDSESISTRCRPTSNVDWHWTLQCGLTWLERCLGKSHQDFLLDIGEKPCWLKTVKTEDDPSVCLLPVFAMDDRRAAGHLVGGSLGNLQRPRHPAPRFRLPR